jgi:hypothetical protein
LRGVEIAVAEQDLDVLRWHFRLGQERGSGMADKVGGDVQADSLSVSLYRSLEVSWRNWHTVPCAKKQGRVIILT